MSNLRVGLIVVCALIAISVIGIATIQRAQKSDKTEEATPVQKGNNKSATRT